MAKAGKSRWAIVVAILAIVAVVAGILIFTGGESEAKQFATLQISEGQVDVRKAGAGFAAGRDGQSLTQGDVIRTGPDGLADITYFDGSLTRLGPDTEFTITELATLDNDAQSKRIKGSHVRGRTWNRVTELADSQSRFEIETPVATAAVKGTVFATFCDFFGNCTYASIEDTIEVLLPDGTVITLGPLDAVTIDADGTVGDVIHFDSLEEMIAAFDWIAENACDIEALADCSPPEPEPEPEPEPTETVTPEPSPTGTTDTGTGSTGSEPTTPVPPAVNSAPVAAFVPANASGPAPLSVSFTNQSTDPDGDPLTFVWNFGDGGLSTAVNPTHVFGAGVWSVTLTARDGSGASDSVSHLVEAFDVTAPAPPTFSSPSPGDVITSSPVTFTGDAEEGSTVQVFDGGDLIGSDVANSPFSVTAALADGLHTITATATDDAGNESAPSAALVIEVDAVNDDPIAGNDALSTNEDVTGSLNVLANDSDPNGDPLSVGSVSNPANGSAANLGGGVVSYTPDPDFNGTDSFTYVLIDGEGGTDTGTVTVTVNPVNDAPNAVNDSATTNEDAPVTINVRANDSDPDGDALTITSVSNPPNGTAAIQSGNVLYTPDPNFNGTDSFTYTISDGNGGSDTATVTVTVGSVNDAPNAVNDSATTNEDSPVTINVRANDSDPDGDALTITSVSNPPNGTAAIQSGSVLYTPDPDFSGSDSFTYTISDGNGGSDTGTVNVTVTSVNDAPDAVNDSPTTNEDNGILVDVLANDTDPDGDELSITDFTQPDNGTVGPPGEGSGLFYTPDPGFSGSDSFTYTISDGNGGSDTATVNVTVTSVNDAPTAALSGSPTSGDADLLVTFSTVGSTDPDDGIASWSLDFGDESSTSGTGTPPASIQHTYTAAGGYTATLTVTDVAGASDTDTESINVSEGNSAPDAVNDNATQNSEGVTVNVLANDTDPGGDTLTVSIVSQPGSGSAVLNVDQSITYTPNEGFSGTDAFTYRVTDPGGLFDEATVTISGVANAVTNVLHWPGPVGRDLDLHVGLPSPHPEVYFGQLCVGDPCWATLDQDVTNGPPGTETVTITTLDGSFVAGSYTIYIDNFSCGEHTYDSTGATVTVNTGSSSQTFSLPSANRDLRQWNVGTLGLDAAGNGSVTPTQTIDGATCGGVVVDSIDQQNARADRRDLDQRGDRELRGDGVRGFRWESRGASEEPLQTLRARVEGTTVSLDWRPQDVRGVVRYSTTEFPTRSTGGRRGCEGTGRCEIGGLTPGTELFLTVFAAGEEETRARRGVNAAQVAIAPAQADPAPTEPAPTEPVPTEPAPTEPAPTEPVPTEPAPTEPAPIEPAPEPLDPAPVDEVTPPPEPVATEPEADSVETSA